jgi:peptidoglycan DL-endopeptidase CwlO
MRPSARSWSFRRRSRVAGQPVALAIVATLSFGVAVALALGGSTPPPARAATSGQLKRQISQGQGRVSKLSGALKSDAQRVTRLNAGISALAARLDALQQQLDASQTELINLRGELSATQVRLGRAQTVASYDEHVLAQQLVGTYEGTEPDLVDVVVESTGFNDLLERLNFVERVGRQDARVVAIVKAARSTVSAEATELGRLSVRQQQVTAQALSERDAVANARLTLVTRELAAARSSSKYAGQLASARTQVASLTAQLTRVQATQRAADKRQAPPVKGGFQFPMPKGDVSPPATWTLDDGVDIAAPGGTPELAVCSGVIVQHGIGGFGPSAPVLHCDSPLAGYDYVYYGHAGPGNWTPIGTHVSQGQVISQVGNGIVGISSGPHLEIGFADSSGAPIGASTAPAMMSLLRAAYSG